MNCGQYLYIGDTCLDDINYGNYEISIIKVVFLIYEVDHIS